MSEILIKGMEMPKQGWKRLILLPNGEVREICGDEAVRATDARAVELPEPHGDLIDRSKLSTTPITDYKLEGHLVVEIEDIENAPTILEASEVKA